jgi:hypothetical protein
MAVAACLYASSEVAVTRSNVFKTALLLVEEGTIASIKDFLFFY